MQDESKKDKELEMYKKSDGALHTYGGQIYVPSPCHTVDTSVSILESYPEQVILDIKKLNITEFYLYQK